MWSRQCCSAVISLGQPSLSAALAFSKLNAPPLSPSNWSDDVWGFNDGVWSVPPVQFSSIQVCFQFSSGWYLCTQKSLCVCLVSFPSVAFQTVPLFAWLTIALSGKIVKRFLFPHLSPPGDQWCDILGFVPACNVSSSSTIQIFRDFRHPVMVQMPSVMSPMMALDAFTALVVVHDTFRMVCDAYSDATWCRHSIYFGGGMWHRQVFDASTASAVACDASCSAFSGGSWCLHCFGGDVMRSLIQWRDGVPWIIMMAFDAFTASVTVHDTFSDGVW